MLEAAPRNMKIPEDMDAGAREAFEELTMQQQQHNDQFDKRSGFQKPEVDDDDNDDED